MPFTPPFIQDSPKRIRAFFGGKYIVDSTKAKLVWEIQAYPTYYFPASELKKEFLQHRDTQDDKEIYDIVIQGHRADAAVTVYTSKAKDVGGLYSIKFSAMDTWFEEEEQLFYHCKNPYTRVDVLQSSRHVRVEVNGVEVANTRMPKLLFETGLRMRTYIPMNDCRMDLLVPSSTITHCPYKGEAKYYHVQIPSQNRQDDIVWWYREPLPECAGIRGYVAFYDEKVDVWIDGEKQKR